MENDRRSSARIQVLAGICGLLWFASGCAGPVSNMRPIEAPQSLEAGMSRIIFMRPNTLGFAIQSSIFEVQGDEARLAGIVAAKKKLAHDVAPGEHLFMVVGEAADFMSAMLEAGRTYYAEVVPRMGVWKARFGLRAIHRDEIETSKPDRWLSASEWVEPDDSSFAWAEQNMPSILKKLNRYRPVWYEKRAKDRPRLEPGDAIDGTAGGR